SDPHNFLGRSNWKGSPGGDEDFDGQMAEVRVWNIARSEAQIRETMFQRLTGKEPGLFGLWNFEMVEDGVVKDSGPNSHHARLNGGARIVSAAVPTPIQLALPSSFTGTISDSSGRPVAGATVQLIRNGAVQTQVTTGTNGDYTLGGVYTDETY